MSLNGILNTAQSGLAAAQTQMQVISENVTNVSTPGYIRQVANQVSTTTGGIGTGVEIASVQLATNNFLESAAQTASANAGSADILAQYYGQLQQLFGDPSSSTSFFSDISSAFASFSSLAQNPTSAPYRQQSISDVQQVFSQASSIYSSIQQVRGQADSQISSDVTQVNSLLSQIATLNKQIAAGGANGQNTSAEQDSQKQLIGQLSGLMNIKVQSQQGGGVTLRTADGTILVNQGNAATLQYTPTSTVTGQTVFNPITLTPPGGVPVDLSQKVSSGEIAGLLQLRDVQAPQAAEQLGELTSQMADQLNKVSNASSAAPPPQTLTGQSIGLDLSSAVSGFTGTTNIVLTDSSGVVQHTLQIDFSSGTMTMDGGGATSFSPGSFLSTLQSQLGTVGASASFSSTGQLSLSAPSGQGVAIADDPTTPSSNGGRGFSWYFGMNNLVTSSTASNYQTGLTDSSPNNFAGGQVVFSLSAGPGTQTSKVTVNIPSGGTMSDVLAALNDPNTGLGQFGSFSLDSNGQLSFTATSTPARSLSVASDTTSWAGGQSLTQLFGVTQGVRADRATSFSINSSILQNPNLLPLATVNLSAAAGTSAISTGDGTGAQAMANAGQASVTFNPAGTDPGGAGSITNYASNFAGAIGQTAASITSAQTQADSAQTAASARLSSVEGVNLDTELTNLQTYQQAYSASARLIQAQKDMFSALISIVGG